MAIRAPEGYSGNLTDEQTAALAKFTEGLKGFIEKSGGTPASSAPSLSSRSMPAEGADPKGPIEPAKPEEEAHEANILLTYHERDMLRFMRARQWDVDKALEMATNSVKWRASVKPWSITPENIPTALPSGVWRWAGYTKSGMPILHVDCENWKPSAYYSVDEYVRYLAYLLEGAVERMGSGTERFCIIYWIPGLSMEMMGSEASKCAKILMKVCGDQFPERLGVAFVCNAPPIFSAMWRMVAPWMDPVTKAKFQIVPRGTNAETLLKYIDAEVLCKILGGQHDDYPVPTRSIAEEIKDFGAPPSASNVTAIMGCTEETIMSGGMSGQYGGTITIRPGYSYSLQIHLEANTKCISWTFDEAKKREFNFGYKVTGKTAPAPVMSGMGAMGGMGGMGGYGGGALASMVAAKGDSLLRSQDPIPVDFAAGVPSGSCDIQATWANGTLNLIFDNTAARFFSANVTYELTVDAADEK